MPKDNVQRAINRGSGGVDGANYEEVRYEGYGVGGAAVIVECMTDNKVRTVAEVRNAFNKNGGNMGTKVGRLHVPALRPAAVRAGHRRRQADGSGPGSGR